MPPVQKLYRFVALALKQVLDKVKMALGAVQLFEFWNSDLEVFIEHLVNRGEWYSLGAASAEAMSSAA